MKNRSSSTGNTNKPPRKKQSNTPKGTSQAAHVSEKHAPAEDRKLQGEQQKGNHGGGNIMQNKFGNQTRDNSVREQQKDQDGDTMGRKGKT